jgi:hypothetical protein
MKWIKKLFKKSVSYMYFKKVTDSYYGMCGTERLYIKTRKATGRFSYMENSCVVNFMNNKGWVEIEDKEYSSAKINT